MGRDERRSRHLDKESGMKTKVAATVSCIVTGALAASVAGAQPVFVVETLPAHEVLLTEQSRDGANTGRPTLVEFGPDYGFVDRSRVNDAMPGEVLVLQHAVPVPHPMRVGPANAGTNPTGSELSGQNSGQ
jgi:hypothetical protein